jgi:hypothetical protein
MIRQPRRHGEGLEDEEIKLPTRQQQRRAAVPPSRRVDRS